jgi:hypothetical protein
VEQLILVVEVVEVMNKMALLFKPLVQEEKELLYLETNIL